MEIVGQTLLSYLIHYLFVVQTQIMSDHGMKIFQKSFQTPDEKMGIKSDFAFSIQEYLLITISQWLSCVSASGGKS